MTTGVRLESQRIWPTDFEMVDLRDTWPHEIVTKTRRSPSAEKQGVAVYATFWTEPS
jgi:hypothetical protein